MSGEAMNPEELILNMTNDELVELLEDMGLESDLAVADGIRRLVAELGSVEAAVIALTDDQHFGRAA